MQVEQKQSEDEKVKIQELQRRIDELTAANLLLQEQLASKEQFTAMIAHDLRSPLTPIINYAQMIIRQQGGQPNPPLHRNANIIISQARRMTRLVSDLLDMSRLSTGKFTLIREECDIVALVIEIVDQLRPVAPHHKLVVDAPDTPIISNCDSGRLQQAVGNLLDNAIKYSDDETIITARVWTTSNMVHVSIHNFGTIIPLEETSQLFLPFVRLAGAGSRQGSGLGLYITKSIIDAHGGTLGLEPAEDADSEEPQGTTFCFTLPLN